MVQVRHGSATTTHAVRAAIQRSQASIAELSRELGLNPKTVAKWRKRQTVEDRKTGPREPRSSVLSEDEEAMIVAFRRHTLLPLDDCLYALQPSRECPIFCVTALWSMLPERSKDDDDFQGITGRTFEGLRTA